MAFVNSRGFQRQGMVLWILEGNQIDFTLSEFLRISEGILDRGLFATLREERPSLEDQILQIYHLELAHKMEPEELEGVVEQSLLDLKQSLRLEEEEE